MPINTTIIIGDSCKTAFYAAEIDGKSGLIGTYNA